VLLLHFAGGVDLPANGGPGSLGVFRTLNFRRAPDGRFAARHGDSYVAMVEFSTPIRARALLSYGNASQPGSKHIGDQLPFLSRNELRPAYRTRQEVLQNLEKRELVP
jgi:acyl-homoserine-lactone acylase